MREILFRGKMGKGDWIYGCYVLTPDDGPVIMTCADWGGKFSHPVIPITVGQFTGLCDKNGKKIFEGDVLTSSRWSCPCHVSFMDGGFTLEEGETAENLGANFYDCEGDEIEDIQVIGNIHEDGDLIDSKITKTN